MDLHHNVKYSRAISPAAAVTDNTAFVSQVLDCANFQYNELIVQLGALADADATFAVLLEESNAPDMSGANTVADADTIGTQSDAGFNFAEDNATIKLGYKGVKHYIRATITPSANGGNVFLAAIWAQGGARVLPQA